MAFDKVGSFRVATSERLESPGDWPNILAGRDGEITPPADSESVRTASRPSTPGEVVAQIADPDRWVFVHTTIMASVDLEEGSEFLVKEASEKWINDNGDAWERTQLLKDFGSFRNAAVYVEHNQHPEHAKGKVFDVVARDMGDTVLVDVLFGVDKRHDDLVNNITAGILNAVSMGCSTAFTKCSVCGNLAHTENDYCEHVANQKRQSVQAHGRSRKVAELCFDNNFFDCSIVASPAFSGAVFRRLVANDAVLKKVFANILCSRMERDPEEFVSDLKKAASIISEAEEKHGSEVSSESLRLEAGIRLFSGKRGTGRVKSIGDRFATVQWDDGDEETIELGSIDTADDRVVAYKEAAKPEVPDTDRAGYHPITNTETQKHEYQVDDRDFSDIPQTQNIGKTHSIDAHNAANPTTKLEGTDGEAFDGVTIRYAALHRHHKCPSCKTVGLEFERRAASMETGGSPDTVLCEGCGAVDMTSEYREAEARELVSQSPDMVLACRVAAIVESPSARAEFLRAVSERKSAGASSRHVEDVLKGTLAELGVEVSSAGSFKVAAPDTAALEGLAEEHGGVTTHDIVSAVGEGEASDAAVVRIASLGADVIPAHLPIADIRSLEKRLESRLEGRWSRVRTVAIGGDAVEHPVARDRVFRAWEGAHDNPFVPQAQPVDFCDECLNGLSDDGVCLHCGKDAKGDCHGCGEENVPLYQGQCAGCFHAGVDADAADAAEWSPEGEMVGAEPHADPAFRSSRTASFEKWPNLLEGVDVPESTEDRRSAAAELARLADSRRVCVRIEASRKVSRILQAHPDLTVAQAKAVLWRDLCEFMPAHDAGHVVSKVVDVKTNDQFGLGRNRPLEDAREPTDEPGAARTMRAS